jgi:hypothetical protein
VSRHILLRKLLLDVVIHILFTVPAFLFVLLDNALFYATRDCILGSNWFVRDDPTRCLRHGGLQDQLVVERRALKEALHGLVVGTGATAQQVREFA